MFHLRFGLSDHLKALLDFVFGSRRRVKKVRIFRAWFSHYWYWRLCLSLCFCQNDQFLASSQEAEARNLVALTRSKGLCLLLFPSTHDCCSFFFSRAFVSMGHLHPARSGVVDPSDPLRPLNLLRWHAASPVTRSRVGHHPMHGNQQAPPSFLPAASIPFFHMGLDRLCQPEPDVLQDPNLNHAAWLAAFAALTGTDLTTEHMALLQHALIPIQFPSRVIAPLQAGDQDHVISCTGPSWAIKKGRPRSTGSQTAPDGAHIQDLSRSTQDALPTWVDKLYLKIAHLAALVSEAQDLPNPGWIKCSTLSTYNGPSIPGSVLWPYPISN